MRVGTEHSKDSTCSVFRKKNGNVKIRPMNGPRSATEVEAVNLVALQPNGGDTVGLGFPLPSTDRKEQAALPR